MNTNFFIHINHGTHLPMYERVKLCSRKKLKSLFYAFTQDYVDYAKIETLIIYINCQDFLLSEFHSLLT